MAKRLPYGETKRKLVLAFDIGTTHSGISYCILDPGVIPKVETVTKFPGLDAIAATAKIPTVIYYDRYGTVMAVGAEAMDEEIYEKAQEEGWINCEWFKLHLRSKTAPSPEQEMAKRIPLLPPGKNLVDVYADFLTYLFECAAKYIKETHPNGGAVWVSTVDERMDFVLCHPNGWGTAQQSEMRKAAVQAGLVADTPTGHARLSFVTEGEASLHYAIQYGLPDPVVKDGEGVVIVDAGGGTIDVSSYSMDSDKKFKEVAPPECHFNGSVSVSIRAAQFFAEFLADSPYRHANDIQQIARCFDRTTKLRFRSSKDPQFVKFGTARDHDSAHNIRYGQLKLEGSAVAAFFDEPIKCIVEAVKGQQNTALKPISHAVLVGGFSSNDWVYAQVSKALSPIGLNVIRPISYVNKAASDGAILFYLDHLITSRVAKVSYGIFCHARYDPSKPDHLARENNVVTSRVNGTRRLEDHFDVILPQGTQVSQAQEFKESYNNAAESMGGFGTISHALYCYRGNGPAPSWKDIDPDNFVQVCSLKVDLSHLSLDPIKHPETEKAYYMVHYDIVLHFGLTELTAQFAWQENGEERRSPPQIIVEPDPIEEGVALNPSLDGSQPQSNKSEHLVNLSAGLTYIRRLVTLNRSVPLSYGAGLATAVAIGGIYWARWSQWAGLQRFQSD